MYLNYRVRIPSDPGKIYPGKPNKKGVVYISYEYGREYRPDKKYNIPKRATIGKQCEDDDTMMYPIASLGFFLGRLNLSRPSSSGTTEKRPCKSRNTEAPFFQSLGQALQELFDYNQRTFLTMTQICFSPCGSVGVSVWEAVYHSFIKIIYDNFIFTISWIIYNKLEKFQVRG